MKKLLFALALIWGTAQAQTPTGVKTRFPGIWFQSKDTAAATAADSLAMIWQRSDSSLRVRANGYWQKIALGNPMVYPGAGIPLSTGSAWGTSYGTTGSGLVALNTSPSLSSPLIDGANPYISFRNGSAVANAAGRMWYDSLTGSWNVGMGGGNITQQIGEEQFWYGKASSAITESPLQIVKQSGTVGASGVIQIAPAGTGVTNGQDIIGVATEDIPLNGFGRVTTFGTVHGITTNGAAYGETWADGDVIWYNPVTGNPTKVKPSAPNLKVSVGRIIKAGSGGSGSFAVEVDHGSILGGTDANVQLGTLRQSDLLVYDSTAGYWKNNSISGAGIMKYTDTAAMLSPYKTYYPRAALSAGTGISYNGSTGVITNSAPDQTVALSNGTGISVTGTYPNFTITNTSPSSGGTVTSIATTAPITGGTITSSGTIGITQATTLTNGYLSSTDWNTFNGKQAALNGTGFVKASGTTISYDNSTYLTTTGNGSGLTGLPTNTALYPTLNQSTSGNAATATLAANSALWNGAAYNGGALSTSPIYALTYDAITNKWQPSNAGGLATFLSLGTNAYTSTAYLPLAGGTLTGTTNISAASAANIFGIISSTGTNAAYQRFTNTGGNYYIGVDNSTGTGLFASGGAAYALGIVAESAQPLILGTNNIARLTISAAGATTLSGALSGTTATFSSTLSADGDATLKSNVYLRYNNTYLYGRNVADNAYTTMIGYGSDGNINIANQKLLINPSTGAATFSSSVTATSATFSGNVVLGTTSLSGGGAAKWLTADGSTYGGGFISSVAGTAKGYTYFDNASGFYINQGASGIGVGLYVDGGSTKGLGIASTGAATFSSTVTATSFIKSGGTSSQSLQADGSVTTLTSGTYTPTITLTTGSMTSISVTSAIYTRVGNIVHVSMAFQGTPPSGTNQYNAFTLTLPVSTAGAPTAWGNIVCQTIGGIPSAAGVVYGYSASTVMFDINTNYPAPNATFTVDFQYQIN